MKGKTIKKLPLGPNFTFQLIDAADAQDIKDG